MKHLIQLIVLSIVFIACGNDAVSTPDIADTTSAQTSTTGQSGSTPLNTATPAHNDSAVRGYVTDNYTLIDTFSKGNRTRVFKSTKNMIRCSYAFNGDKILYNTGVKTDAFTAVLAGFNSGSYTLQDAPMDGIVFRLIQRNNYWFIQCDVANGYIHESCTVDVLYIRNSEIDSE